MALTIRGRPIRLAAASFKVERSIRKKGPSLGWGRAADQWNPVDASDGVGSGRLVGIRRRRSEPLELPARRPARGSVAGRSTHHSFSFPADFQAWEARHRAIPRFFRPFVDMTLLARRFF